jgi:GT2 family glycosyltransferase
MKKLIIYIPSYNRSDRLMSQLKVINKEMSSDIKVVISDNNSTDIESKDNCIYPHVKIHSQYWYPQVD